MTTKSNSSTGIFQSIDIFHIQKKEKKALLTECTLPKGMRSLLHDIAFISSPASRVSPHEYMGVQISILPGKVYNRNHDSHAI